MENKIFTLFKKNIGYVVAVLFFMLFIESSVSNCQDKKFQKQLIENETKRAILERDAYWQIQLAEKDRKLSEIHENNANRQREIIDSITKSIQVKHKWKNYSLDETQNFFDTITRKSTLKPVEW